MSLTTEEKNYNQVYNIAEYAIGRLSFRNNFGSSESLPAYRNNDELYRSVYLYDKTVNEYCQNNNNSISKYDGTVWTDQLIIDIDDSENLSKALESTRKLLQTIEAIYEIDIRYLAVNFSGSKGFHIRIPAVLFGHFEPSQNLPRTIKRIAAGLAGDLKIDMSVYDKTRLMRVVNTINQKSGLFSVPLTCDELFKYTIEEIKQLAQSPRQIASYDLDELIPVSGLVELKNSALLDITNSKIVMEKSEESGSDKFVPNYFVSARETERHEKMNQLIGHLAAHNFSDDEIKNAVVAWNQLNNPPKDETELLKDLKHSLETMGNNKGPFWSIRRAGKNGRSKAAISLVDLINYLEELGYGKKKLSKSYVFVKQNSNRLKEVELFEIKDEIIKYISENKALNETNRKMLLNQLITYSGMFFGTGKIECLRSLNAEIRRDTSSESYLYFKNGFVSVSGDCIKKKEYADMQGLIWETQVIEHKINLNSGEENKSVFEKFLRNVSRHSEERFRTLQSAIGYLLHEYKDSSNAKAIILVDEKIPANGEPNGRTGKSILGKAISLIRRSSRIDAKNFEFDSKFTFQEVYLDTKIVEFNDVKKNFSFENLFSVITDDMTVEYKGVPKYKIPFAESPKFLISTNYTIKGRGSSYTDRLFEIEFSDFYNEHHKPTDDFGHVFFTDAWDSAEWNRFYVFMIECLQLYLREGLVGYSRINLERRKLIDQTSQEFLEFAEEEIKPDVEYNKKELFNRFGMKYIDFSQLKQRTFTGWVEEFCKYKGYKYEERKSDGRDLYVLRSSTGSIIKKSTPIRNASDGLFR